jgi:chromosome segregation ATPase
MSKAIRTVATVSIAALILLSLSIVGCTSRPDEEQLQLLDETKAAALAAEQELADCQSNNEDLSAQLAEKKDELEAVKQEKEDVMNRLEAMGN